MSGLNQVLVINVKLWYKLGPWPHKVTQYFILETNAKGFLLAWDVHITLYIHLALMLRCQCPSVCPVTEVHWRIIANLSFKFWSNFTAHCGCSAWGARGGIIAGKSGATRPSCSTSKWLEAGSMMDMASLLGNNPITPVTNHFHVVLRKWMLNILLQESFFQDIDVLQSHGIVSIQY